MRLLYHLSTIALFVISSVDNFIQAFTTINRIRHRSNNQKSFLRYTSAASRDDDDEWIGPFFFSGAPQVNNQNVIRLEDIFRKPPSHNSISKKKSIPPRRQQQCMDPYSSVVRVIKTTYKSIEKPFYFSVDGKN